MNSHTTLLQTILENTFLYNTIPTLGIICSTCERLFGSGIDSIVTDQDENGFTMEVTAKGNTTAVYFKTAPSFLAKGNIRIIGIEL